MNIKKILCLVLSLLFVVSSVAIISADTTNKTDETETAIDYIFMVQDKEYSRQTVKNLDTLKQPADPEVEGLAFVGWFINEYQLFNTDQDKDGIIDEEIVSVTAESKDITVIAKFKDAMYTGVSEDEIVESDEKAEPEVISEKEPEVKEEEKVVEPTITVLSGDSLDKATAAVNEYLAKENKTIDEVQLAVDIISNGVKEINIKDIENVKETSILYHIADDDTVSEVAYKYDNNVVSFESTEFSPFILATVKDIEVEPEKEDKQDRDPNRPDGLPDWVPDFNYEPVYDEEYGPEGEIIGDPKEYYNYWLENYHKYDENGNPIQTRAVTGAISGVQFIISDFAEGRLNGGGHSARFRVNADVNSGIKKNQIVYCGTNRIRFIGSTDGVARAGQTATETIQKATRNLDIYNSRKHQQPNVDMIKKILWYGQEGPGQIDSTTFRSIFGINYNADKFYQICHFAITQNGVVPIGTSTGDWSRIGQTTRTYVFNFINWLESQPTPPDDFIVYIYLGYGKTHSRNQGQDMYLWSYNPNGKLQGQKKGANSALLSQFPLTGAEFTVYTNSACTTIAKDADGNNAVLKVTASSENTYGSGYTQIITIKPGTYYVKETKAPSGYSLSTAVVTVTVTSSGTAKVEFTNSVIPYNLKIKKTSPTTQYSPIGCKFTVYTNSECTTVAKDINGNNAVLTVQTAVGSYYESNSVSLYPGTYYVKETTAVEPFELNTTVKSVSITTADAVVEFDNTIRSGLVYVQKTSDCPALQSDYPFTGAKFTVYTTEACTAIAKDTSGNNAVLTADASGKTNTISILPGTYWVKETTAPTGYELDTSIKKVVVTKGETASVTFTDHLIVHSITIIKVSDGSIYSVEGAEFTLYKEQACTNVVKDVNGNNVVMKVKKFTEGGNTVYKTDKFTIPAGLYYVKETKAPTNGHFKLDTTVRQADARNNDVVLTITNETLKCHFKVHKVSTQPNYIEQFPITGAKFTVYTDAECSQIAKDIYGNNAVLTVRNNDGDTNEIELALGTYWVKETYVPEHYVPHSTAVQISCETSGENKVLEFENILQVGLGKVQKTW